MELVPEYSGDTVEDFHVHLRRWDSVPLEEPGSKVTEEGEGIALSSVSSHEPYLIGTPMMVEPLGPVRTMEPITAQESVEGWKTPVTSVSPVGGPGTHWMAGDL